MKQNSAHERDFSQTPSSDTLRDSLKKLFGFDAFRPGQEQIIGAILAGRDVFAVMPTGGGKSLCYQLPAHILPGTCLVVSPLISLMKDQVDAAAAQGLRAAFVNSSQSGWERARVLDRLATGTLDLLYVSPERLALEGFVERLGDARLCLAAIDEAHCISEWGHDFRPDYLFLAELSRRLPHVPIAAFTATATRRVQQDILSRLNLRHPLVHRASFDRPNLFYHIEPKRRVLDQILSFVRSRPGESGIVYRTTRKAVEETAAALCAAGLEAAPYHAGMTDEQRAENQEAFRQDRIPVIVGTIAFGMGIDKPNVRYVIHGDLPKNLSSYYQETGRAGRDGDPAHCRLFFGRGDIPKIRYFIDRMEDEDERMRAVLALNAMVSFAGSSGCRRAALLRYFDERYPRDNCESCDICVGTRERVDATTDARKLLSAIVRTGQRFGIGHVVDVVCGADTRRIRSLGHDRLPTYGVGKDKNKRQWRDLLDDLLAQGILVRTDERLPVLRLGAYAGEVLKGTRPVSVIRRELPREKPLGSTPPPAANSSLFERLRALRTALARKQGIPPYMVFADRTLRDMAARAPRDETAMLMVSGVGDAKLRRYGRVFLEEIERFTVETEPEIDD